MNERKLGGEGESTSNSEESNTLLNRETNARPVEAGAGGNEDIDASVGLSERENQIG